MNALSIDTPNLCGLLIGVQKQKKGINALSVVLQNIFNTFGVGMGWCVCCPQVAPVVIRI